MHFQLKLKRIFRKNSIKNIALVVLISSLGFSLISTIWSIYLYEFLKNEAYVGYISTFMVLISILSYFAIIPVIEKSNKIKLGILAFLFIGLGYLIYFFTQSFSLILITTLFINIAITLKVSALGLITEFNSTKKNLSQNEGVIYSFSNLAYMIGPLLAGILLMSVGIKYIFLLSSILIFLSGIILKNSKLKRGKIKKRTDKKLIRNFKDFFKNKERRTAYFLSATITFWWSLIYTFLPLLLLSKNAEYLIGPALFLNASPLLLEYKFGKMAVKKGYKKLFLFGFAIPAIMALICFFATNVYLILLLLFLASFGLAMTESTTESYFFDLLGENQDQRFYAPYNTAIDTGYLLGTGIGGLILSFFSFNYLFLFYFLIMSMTAVLSWRIKDIIETKKTN